MTNALQRRWREHAGEGLTAEVFERLAQGGALDGLELGRTDDGRWDLRGMTLAPARIIDRRGTATTFIEERAGIPQLTKVALTGLDLSAAVLDDLQLTNVQIEDCVFDRASWRRGRLFSCEVSQSTFRKTNMKDMGIGPIHDKKRTRFRDSLFDGADFRNLACESARFDRCTFIDIKTKELNFGGTIFTDCVFAGLLEDITFSARPWDKKRFHPNEMQNVSFRDAELLYVTFQDLQLDTVVWPATERNEVFEHFPCVLETMVAELEHDERPRARGVAASFRAHLRTMPRRRRFGAVHRDELGGLADELLPRMRHAEERCSR